MVPVEPDLKVSSTGQEATRLVPCMSISSSDWVSARVSVEARALGWELARLGCKKINLGTNNHP